MDENSSRIISACAGSLITSLLVTPFDVIRIRLQSQQQQSPSLLNNRINGTIDGLFKIAKHEGPSRLWRGLTATLIMGLPSTAIYMVGYESLRDRIRGMQSNRVNEHRRHDLAPLFAGSIARSFAAVCISPLEMLRTRIQQSSNAQRKILGKYYHAYILYLTYISDISKDLMEMYRREGVLSLWRGLGVTLWRDVPFSAIYWLGYESGKQELLQAFPDTNELLAAFISGASSGCIAAIVTTPFDVAKTRRQMQLTVETDKRLLESANEARILRVLRTIYLNEGWRGLFSGMTARVSKIAPSCAVMIATYEFGKSLL